MALAYQKFDEQTKQKVKQEYLASIDEFHNGKSYDVPGEFVITRGIKADD